VQLLNGNDLTGWKKHPDAKASWEVVDGTLVGHRAGRSPFQRAPVTTRFSLPHRG